MHQTTAHWAKLTTGAALGLLSLTGCNGEDLAGTGEDWEARLVAAAQGSEFPVLQEMSRHQILASAQEVCDLYDAAPAEQNVAFEVIMDYFTGTSAITGIPASDPDAADAAAGLMGGATHSVCPEHAEDAKEEAEELAALND